MNTSKIFVIAGPTGCGESTITKAIIEKFPNFARLVTATSRLPRLNEKNGVDYFFFSKEDFENEIIKGNIIEHTYIENRDTYYGSYKIDLENKLNQGISIIVNPDIVGSRFYKENYGAVTIFVKPDSLENLKKRLIAREPNIEKNELQRRLQNAENEIENEEKYYDYVVVNEEGKLNQAIQDVEDIIKKYV